MFERFTQAARRTVVLAQQESFERNAPEVGAEHVLTALAMDADSVAGTTLAGLGLGPARVRDLIADLPAELTGGRSIDPEALAALGIDLAEVRRQVDAEFGPGALARGRRPRRKAHARFSSEAKRLLEGALREAVQRKDKSLNTEHLLLAAIELPVASSVLAAAGLAADEVRAAVSAELRTRRLSA